MLFWVGVALAALIVAVLGGLLWLNREVTKVRTDRDWQTLHHEIAVWEQERKRRKEARRHRA